MARLGIEGEVVIADNGSTDGSQEIADRCGRPGRARAASRATAPRCAAASPRREAPTSSMGDADDSYDFDDARPVRGRSCAAVPTWSWATASQGGIAPGAMPPLHRYWATPSCPSSAGCSSACRCGDFHCGHPRASARDAIWPRPAHDRHGVRERDGGPGRARRARHRRGARRRCGPTAAAGRPTCAAGATAGGTCAYLLLFSPRWLFLYPVALCARRQRHVRGPVGRIRHRRRAHVRRADHDRRRHRRSSSASRPAAFALVSRAFRPGSACCPATNRLERALDQLHAGVGPRRRGAHGRRRCGRLRRRRGALVGTASAPDRTTTCGSPRRDAAGGRRHPGGDGVVPAQPDPGGTTDRCRVRVTSLPTLDCRYTVSRTRATGRSSPPGRGTGRCPGPASRSGCPGRWAGRSRRPRWTRTCR